jgi:hypothetical protein
MLQVGRADDRPGSRLISRKGMSSPGASDVRFKVPLPRRDRRFPKSSNDFGRPVLDCRLGKQKPEKS